MTGARVCNALNTGCGLPTALRPRTEEIATRTAVDSLSPAEHQVIIPRSAAVAAAAYFR